MKTQLKYLWVALAGLGLACTNAAAQSAGTARLEATIASYSGAGPQHWTVAWVTTDAGVFVKTLRKQGTKYGWTSSQWQTHCTTWNNARGGTSGSTMVDGYTSATATTYSGTNSPIILTWNGRDTNNVLMPDGYYRFWVQYVEDDGVQGPYTTGGLRWYKGSTGGTNTYANQGANFSNLKVAWTPIIPVPPAITSAPPPAGTVGVPYNFACTATGTTPISFTATGLPSGLTISANGLITGTPTIPGTFPGTIRATNGTLPNATQNISFLIKLVPAGIASVELEATNLVLTGYGPTNGTYVVLASTNVAAPTLEWMPIKTNSFGSQGKFRFTNAISSSVEKYYRLRVP